MGPTGQEKNCSRAAHDKIARLSVQGNASLRLRVGPRGRQFELCERLRFRASMPNDIRASGQPRTPELARCKVINVVLHTDRGPETRISIDIAHGPKFFDAGRGKICTKRDTPKLIYLPRAHFP